MSDSDDIERILELLDDEEAAAIALILATLSAFIDWLKRVAPKIFVRVSLWVSKAFNRVRGFFQWLLG